MCRSRASRAPHRLPGCRAEAAPDGSSSSSVPPRQRRVVASKGGSLGANGSGSGSAGGKGAASASSKPVLGYTPAAEAPAGTSTSGGGSGAGGAPHGAAHARATRAEQQQQQGAAQVGAAAADQGPALGSWEEWRAYMLQQDDIAQEADGLYDELDAAIEAENYGVAAAVKRQLDEIEAADVVGGPGGVLAQLDAAVAEERYADAAALRDAGGAGLLGWWVGRGGREDYQGHLLHITPDFGRYVGHAFTAADVARLASQHEQASPFALMAPPEAGGDAATRGDEGGTLEGEEGTPVFELFVRRGAGGGALEQQLAVLLGEEAAATAPEDLVLSEVEAALPNSVISVERGETEDGAQFMTIHLRSPDDDGSASGVADGPTLAQDGSMSEIEAEAYAALEALGIGDGAVRPADAGEEAEEPEEEENDGTTTIEQLAEFVRIQLENGGGEEEEGEGDPKAEDAPAAGGPPSLRDAVARLQEQQETFAADLAALRGQLESSSYGEQERKGLEDAIADVQQHIADSTAARAAAEAGHAARAGRDAGAGGAASGGGAAADAWDSEASSGGFGQRRRGGEGQGPSSSSAPCSEESPGPLMPSELGFPSMVLQRAPATLAWHSRDSFSVTVLPPDAAADARGSGGGGGVEAPSDSRGRTADLSIQVASDGSSSGAAREVAVEVLGAPRRPGQPGRQRGPRQGGQEARGEPQAQAGPPSAAASSSSAAAGEEAAAQQQEQQQQQRQGQPGGELADAQARLVRDIERLQADKLAGKAVPPERVREFLRDALGKVVGAGGGAADAHRAALVAAGPTTYRRLDLAAMPRTDVFSGIYTGAFGPHGPELLHIARARVEGEEWALGTKLTGDENVPAGEVSFRARIGRQHRLPIGPSTSRSGYPPELGVVARYQGQGRVAQMGFQRPTWVDGELLVFAANNAVWGGAELGFAFHVDSGNRFLILFSRLYLEDLLPPFDSLP
eukprot:scaffold7.g3539.t1